MISTEGAALIATLLPIGILILGFEIRRAPQMAAMAPAGRVVKITIGVAITAALLCSLGAMWTCVVSVSSNVPVSEDDAVLVGLAGALLFGTCSTLLPGSSMDALGVMDWLGDHGARRLEKSPRRLARAMEYAKKHNRLRDE